MKIKIIEKRNIFIGILTIIYFYSFIFIFSNQIILFIEKRIFGYEHPNDFGYLNFIPPAEIIIPTVLIYLLVTTLVYISILRLIRHLK